MNNKKVLIGLSGGVDSSVAAYILRERGYEVIGACLKLYQEANEIEDARKVAEHLEIPFYVFDFSEKFKEDVIDNFANQYASGKTPNPCLICNHKIKWAALLEKADELGADYIATGHYAKIVDGAPMPNESGKDQTYALCMVRKDQLARTLMPLGDYTKDEVRKIATEQGLPTASKSDSMDICFVPDGDYAGFLKRYTETSATAKEFNGVEDDFTDKNSHADLDSFSQMFKPGNFVNTEGKILGQHKGIVHYTVGQRRGLGISADRPLYVIRIDVEKNEVVLGYEEDVKSCTLIASDVNWLIDAPEKEIEVIAKIRYNHQGSKAKLTAIEGGKAQIIFDEPVKAITPGQAAVFYKDGQLIGGGTIE